MARSDRGHLFSAAIFQVSTKKYQWLLIKAIGGWIMKPNLAVYHHAFWFSFGTVNISMAYGLCAAGNASVHGSLSRLTGIQLLILQQVIASPQPITLAKQYHVEWS